LIRSRVPASDCPALCPEPGGKGGCNPLTGPPPRWGRAKHFLAGARPPTGHPSGWAGRRWARGRAPLPGDSTNQRQGHHGPPDFPPPPPVLGSWNSRCAGWACRTLVMPDPRHYTLYASPMVLNTPGGSRRVRRRLGHPLDSPAGGGRPGCLPEALGGLLPPPGRAGPPQAPGGAPRCGRRGGRGAERLRQLLPPRPRGPLPPLARPERPLAAVGPHRRAQGRQAGPARAPAEAGRGPGAARLHPPRRRRVGGRGPARPSINRLPKIWRASP
jgi:hypothetical protein